MSFKLLINGASGPDEIPGFSSNVNGLEVDFAPDGETLRSKIAGTRVLLGWNFTGRDLRAAWPNADALEWIHWCGAGVDAALFPELRESDVTLTNARGIFDRPMAEHVLGVMLTETKDLRRSLDLQRARTWKYRQTGLLKGQRVVIVGVGSIGREVARLLGAAGLEVSGVGRTARSGDPDFGTIHSADDLGSVLPDADWVVGILPGTPDTRHYYDAQFFGAMKSDARFINIGRGMSVDEDALLDALRTGTIAGAALDVFETEPLDEDHPFWTLPNMLITPHNSGDYRDFETDIAGQFYDNLRRFRDGEPLVNQVDKQLGFVPS